MGLLKVASAAVPMLSWLNADCYLLWRVKRQLLPLSTPLSSWQSVLSWLGLFLLGKFLSTSTLLSCGPFVISILWLGLSACSFLVTLAWPRLLIHISLSRLRMCLVVSRSVQPLSDSTVHERFNEFDNDGLNDLSVTLRGQLLYCEVDCFCLHGYGQTGGNGFEGTPFFVCGPPS